MTPPVRTPTVTYSNGGTYQARVLVTDTGGLSSTSAAVPITVTTVSGPTNTAPPDGHRDPGSRRDARLDDRNVDRDTTPITYARQWQRCTSTIGPSYSGAVGADAPSVYWRLGETTGTAAADSSGFGPSGHLRGRGDAEPAGRARAVTRTPR